MTRYVNTVSGEYDHLSSFYRGPLPNLLRIVLLVVSPAVVWVGLAALWINRQLGIIVEQQYLVSNHVALVWILAGALLLFTSITQKLSKTISGVVLGLTLLTHTLGATSLDWSSHRKELVLLVTTLLIIGVVATLLAQYLSKNGRFRPNTLAIFIALAGSGISVLGTTLLLERSVSQIRIDAQTTTAEVAHSIQSAVYDATRLLERQAGRWHALNGTVPQSYVDLEFATYVKDIPAFKRIVQIDHAYRPIKAWHADEMPSWIKTMIDEHRRRHWFEQVKESGQTRFTPLNVPTNTDNPSMLFVTPLSNSLQGHMGFTLVQTDLRELINGAFANQTPPCCFELSTPQQLLYQRTSTQPGEVLTLTETNIKLHHDFDVHLKYWTQAQHTEFGLGLLPEFCLIAGLLFTFFTNGSYRLAFVAKRRSVQLHSLALHDPLTGLPNRRMLEEMLTEAARRSYAQDKNIALIFIDVSGIRLINDSLGHVVGDALLAEVAIRLKSCSAPGADIARLEGGEFIVCIEGLDLQAVDDCTKRLIEALERPYFFNDAVLRLSAVAGIATNAAGQHLIDPMVLLREADLAMLKAKKDGSSWQRFTQDLSLRVAENLSLRNDLQNALESNELQLYYQPIVCGRTGEVVSLEALMRWNHPDLGPISPARFIPLAEQTGQICALTDWVLQTACRDSDRMAQAGLAQLPIAVNISPIYFARKDFIQRIRTALQVNGLAPELLAIEITEGVLLDDLSEAITKLAQLKDMGIQTSLDDFGTGYSSLSYLKKLPIAKVKIDRSFIVDVTTDPIDSAIIKGISDMAHHLGLIVVVEGVETVEQFNLLNQMGCDQFQGYLFSRPSPFSNLADAFESTRRVPHLAKKTSFD